MARESIRKIVNSINNPDENGGLWLPKIQRYFVWSEEQICRLFDSIMRGYPLSSILIWRTKDKVSNRKFIDNYRENLNISQLYNEINDRTKRLVLDGQQRLQSLYISLKGLYNGKEIFLDVQSCYIDHDPTDDIRYNFAFMEPGGAVPIGQFMVIDKRHLRVKDIVFKTWQASDLEDLCRSLTDDITESAKRQSAYNDMVNGITNLKNRLTSDDDGINEVVIDSIDNPQLYKIDDVVEIFIRANSAGTRLEKSDLLFSLLTSKWDEVEDDLFSFQDELAANSFPLDRDFILKTALILNGMGAKYAVDKFRDNNNITQIANNWSGLKDSIRAVIDFLKGNTFINSSAVMPGFNPIIPLIYFHFHYPSAWQQSAKSELAMWLLRCFLASTFSGSADSILDGVVALIKKKADFDIADVNGEIESRGRNTKITEAALYNNYYGGDKIFLIFNLIYRNANFQPLYANNRPSEDHIFPQSLLKEQKKLNPETNRQVMKYSRWDRDQIANLMLLSIHENRDLKNAMAPDEWFAGKPTDYFEMHCVPQDLKLLKIGAYEQFIQARKVELSKALKKLNVLQ